VLTARYYVLAWTMIARYDEKLSRYVVEYYRLVLTEGCSILLTDSFRNKVVMQRMSIVFVDTLLRVDYYSKQAFESRDDASTLRFYGS
jgi:hypothetical protein